MTEDKKILFRSDLFKKVSALVALIGVLIAATVGIYQLNQEISKTREHQKEVKIQISTGDRFLKSSNYDRALEEYEKGLQFDNDNIETYRKIITTKRKRLQYKTFIYSDHDTKEVEDTLALIYRVQALNPSLKDDVELLLEEALLLEFNDRQSESIMILEKAHNLSPENPDVLAELGYIRIMFLSNDDIEGLDFIRQAITIEPDNVWFHYYLAEASEEAGLYVDAIRKYNETATLASYEKDWPKRLQDRSFGHIRTIFIDHACNDSLLTAEFDMPLEERVDIVEYLIENYDFYNENVYIYLARTHYELGDLENAAKVLYSYPRLEYEYSIEINDLRVALIMILEEGSFDETKLEEVRAMTYFDSYSYLKDKWPKAYAYFTEMKSKQSATEDYE